MLSARLACFRTCFGGIRSRKTNTHSIPRPERSGNRVWLVRLLLSLLLLAFGGVCGARVDSVKIRDRQVIPATEQYPAYERLSGTVRFAIDPALAVNQRISDISLVRTTHPHGWAVASANFLMLRPMEQPEDPVALLEISNRGGIAGLRYFQRGEFSLEPELPEHFGDGLLMRRGMTLVWVGWQWDVPEDGQGRLRLEVPYAPSRDPANYGLVRSDWVVDEPVELLALAHRNHQAYRPARSVDPRNVLTRRRARLGPREIIPRSRWDFVIERNPLGNKAPHLKIDGNAEPGFIYELTYVAKDPKLVGLGLAAIRDMASWLKHAADAPIRVGHVLSFGVSQTGRFARQFLYQGFNEDEQGRRALDGLLIHSAGGGRGSFNHRFAQPSRDGHRYSAFFYPTDLFPFSGTTQLDSVSGQTDGLLATYQDPSLLPRIVYTNTGYEYWGRSAALLHVSPDGTRDVPPLSNERIYHLASGQHFVGAPPDPANAPGDGIWRSNPLDFLVNLRALLLRLEGWVVRGEAPPPSRYPKLADGSLVAVKDFRFPSLAGVAAPPVAQEAYRANYGRRWRQGIIDLQPPELGTAFPVLVPAVDDYGNERGGIRNLEIVVPAATYTPWARRDGLPNPTELKDFTGLLVPLRTCRHAGDSRPMLAETVPTEAVAEAADELIDGGYVHPEDRQRIIASALDRHRWARELTCLESDAAVADLVEAAPQN
ncbi:MAG: alpha/beta hydrolase domain-containing protein [Pseudomonadota bacterium]